MRLPRMTTRRWMIDVAVVAMLVGWIVGAEWLRRRRDEFLSRATASRDRGHLECELAPRSIWRHTAAHGPPWVAGQQVSVCRPLPLASRPARSARAEVIATT